MKNRILLLIFTLFALQARSQILQPRVIGAAGAAQADAANNARLSFTVGETAIATLMASGVSFGQGFHNGVLLTVDTDNPGLAEWGLKIFPNPTTQTLFVEFSQAENQADLKASIWDVAGRQIAAPQTLEALSGNAIDVSALPSGTYFLQLLHADGRSLAVGFVKAE
jgi:hypothetical protein